MGEKIGFMTTLLIFGIGIIPLLISTFTDHTQSAKLLTISTEVQQMVTAEGGVTEIVEGVVSNLANQGVEVSFWDKEGNPITGIVPVGEEIVIQYEWGDFNTTNQVLVTKRN